MCIQVVRKWKKEKQKETEAETEVGKFMKKPRDSLVSSYMEEEL